MAGQVSELPAPAVAGPAEYVLPDSALWEMTVNWHEEGQDHGGAEVEDLHWLTLALQEAGRPPDCYAPGVGPVRLVAVRDRRGRLAFYGSVALGEGGKVRLTG